MKNFKGFNNKTEAKLVAFFKKGLTSLEIGYFLIIVFFNLVNSSLQIMIVKISPANTVFREYL